MVIEKFCFKVCGEQIPTIRKSPGKVFSSSLKDADSSKATCADLEVCQQIWSPQKIHGLDLSACEPFKNTLAPADLRHPHLSGEILFLRGRSAVGGWDYLAAWAASCCMETAINSTSLSDLSRRSALWHGHENSNSTQNQVTPKWLAQAS